MPETNSWEYLLEAVKYYDGEIPLGYTPEGRAFVERLQEESEEEMVIHLKATFSLLKGDQRGRDEVLVTNVAHILAFVLARFPKDRAVIFVRAGLKCLAEEINAAPTKVWPALWYFFAANNSLVEHAVQKRQLRALAKKLLATHPGYHEDYFLTDQLIFIPKRMRISRLERYKHFHEKKPKWLCTGSENR